MKDREYFNHRSSPKTGVEARNRHSRLTPYKYKEGILRGAFFCVYMPDLHRSERSECGARINYYLADGGTK